MTLDHAKLCKPMLNNQAMTRIKKLSPLLINQLAAGEVVTRPAAVVKELLENAIDAGATNIEVHITQGGMGMIEVIDDGIGIHPDDMVMAITRHATSKVADIASLQGITTLGFRGEALASTAAVSRLSLSSSYDDSGIGRQLQVAGVLADSSKLIPIVHNRGTTVTVKDLYFNVPARRGNLKSIATEFTHIETIVREVALARADVSLSLFHEQKKRLSLSLAPEQPTRSIPSSLADYLNNNLNNKRLPLARLEQALGIALADNAIEIIVDLASLLQQSAMATAATKDDTKLINNQSATISGWLWPIHDEQQASPKLLYVNGRLIKEPIISNQLRQLATSAQLNGLGYALYFELPNHWLNINVHPSKQRIKISPLNNVMAHLSHAIALKLKNTVTQQAVANQAVSNTAITEQKSVSNPLVSNKLPVIPASKNQDSKNQAATTRAYLTAALASAYQKVEVSKQPYQLSGQLSGAQPASRKLSAYSKPQAAVQNRQIEASKLVIAAFPKCLEVISDSAKTLAATISAEDKFPALPWLLFYAESQYLLISAQAWQQGLDYINDNQMSVPSLIVDRVSDAEAVCLDNTATAASINQQLAMLTTQLSITDLAEFTLAFTEMLNKDTFKSITTEQLITLMLSS
jgi:DNA mismatch repair protein MutL